MLVGLSAHVGIFFISILYWIKINKKKIYVISKDPKKRVFRFGTFLVCLVIYFIILIFADHTYGMVCMPFFDVCNLLIWYCVAIVLYCVEHKKERGDFSVKPDDGVSQSTLAFICMHGVIHDT